MLRRSAVPDLGAAALDTVWRVPMQRPSMRFVFRMLRPLELFRVSGAAPSRRFPRGWCF